MKRFSSSAVNYVSKTMKTNMLNSLWMPFFKRQGYMIKCFIQENNISTPKTTIRCLLNDWQCKREIPDLELQLVTEFIEQQRSLLVLATDEVVSKIWLKKSSKSS